MTWEDLKPAQIFVDASNRNRRIVILKVIHRDMVLWVATVGKGEPRVKRLADFYWTPITPHKKWRRSGYYLDPDIPNNVPEEWRLAPPAKRG